MRRLRPFLVLAACLAALALTAAPAAAESPVTRNCYADRGVGLTRHYSIAQLRNAMATMPADVKEYSNCFTVIEDQLYRQLGQTVPGIGASSAGSGGSVISTPLLAILIVVVIGGGGLAYVAWRRGGGGGSPPTAAPS